MLGGGLRQAGVLAAAGIHALDHHVERLADDHANAVRLAAGLGAIAGISLEAQATNMVFITVADAPADLEQQLAERGISTRIASGADGRASSRLVTHLGVSADDIESTIDAFAAVGATTGG